jgi:hypothetical protein
VANRSVESGITLDCAISVGQDAGGSCRYRGLLLPFSGCCRLGGSASQRFRAKSLAHPDSDCFPDARLCADTQPDANRDPKRSHAHQSESNSYSNPDRDSDTNAIVSRVECHPDTYANASGCFSLGVRILSTSQIAGRKRKG